MGLSLLGESFWERFLNGFLSIELIVAPLRFGSRSVYVIMA